MTSPVASVAQSFDAATMPPFSSRWPMKIRVVGGDLLEEWPDMWRRRRIVDQAQLPVAVALGEHRGDAVLEHVDVGVVDGRQDRDERLGHLGAGLGRHRRHATGRLRGGSRAATARAESAQVVGR